MDKDTSPEPEAPEAPEPDESIDTSEIPQLAQRGAAWGLKVLTHLARHGQCEDTRQRAASALVNLLPKESRVQVTHRLAELPDEELDRLLLEQGWRPPELSPPGVGEGEDDDAQ